MHPDSNPGGNFGVFLCNVFLMQQRCQSASECNYAKHQCIKIVKVKTQNKTQNRAIAPSNNQRVCESFAPFRIQLAIKPKK